jgi:hypothetical protein
MSDQYTPIYVSPGKIVTIFNKGKSLTPGIQPILNEDFSLQISQQYSPLVSNDISTKIAMLGNLTSGLLSRFGIDVPNSFQHTTFGMKIWNHGEPLVFNLNLNFFMGSAGIFSGFKEVYEPIMKLVAVSLPSIGALGFLKGPGPRIDEQIEIAFSNDVNSLSIQIGNLFLIRNIIIEQAEPTFSTEVDEDGYPIKGNLSLSISTVNIATIDMLETLEKNRQALQQKEDEEYTNLITFDPSQFKNSFSAKEEAAIKKFMEQKPDIIGTTSSPEGGLEIE